MSGFNGRWSGARATLFVIIGSVGVIAATGCAGGSMFQFTALGTPFQATGEADSTVATVGSSGRTSGGALDTGDRSSLDPCLETQDRKFVRISLRSLVPYDYVHYFLVLIAYVNSDEYPEGAVCPEDRDIYTSFGYTYVSAGNEVPFGNYCIEGPALYYFHRNGQFRSAGAAGLASAIGPAQGASATYDNYFGATGARVPVPNHIVFHNPGTSSEGGALRFSENTTFPCDPTSGDVGDPPCQQDAFYYVDDRDTRSGVIPTDESRVGSYVRFPDEIQGTECQCGTSNFAWATLAPSGATASDARCQEFFRGGHIDFAFVREDVDPPYPQLVWRVTDSNGARAHDFDSRAGVP